MLALHGRLGGTGHARACCSAVCPSGRLPTGVAATSTVAYSHDLADPLVTWVWGVVSSIV